MPTANSAATPPEDPLRFQLWEFVVSLVVLLAALGNLAALGFTASGQWRVVIESIRNGTFKPWVFVLPLIPVLAAVLLVLRSRWALPLFVMHVFASFAYIFIFHGMAAFQWYLWLGYGAELCVVYFCVHLLNRGALT
jgi:hypothetical protein